MNQKTIICLVAVIGIIAIIIYITMRTKSSFCNCASSGTPIVSNPYIYWTVPPKIPEYSDSSLVPLSLVGASPPLGSTDYDNYRCGSGWYNQTAPNGMVQKVTYPDLGVGVL